MFVLFIKRTKAARRIRRRYLDDPGNMLGLFLVVCMQKHTPVRTRRGSKWVSKLYSIRRAEENYAQKQRSSWKGWATDRI
jgi:hypothetical protein